MNALDRGDAVYAGQADIDQNDLRVVARDSFERLLPGFHRANELEVVKLAEQEVKSLTHNGVIVNAQAASPCSHCAMVQRTSHYRYEPPAGALEMHMMPALRTAMGEGDGCSAQSW